MSSTKPTRRLAITSLARCLMWWAWQDDLKELSSDPLTVWRDWAENVQGRGLDCGHHLAEEAPGETYAALHAFFSA